MNYGDHNFIEIIQQTKLRVAPFELVVSERVELDMSRPDEPIWIWA